MANPELLVSMGLFAIVATITPGGATALATASGARFGFRRSVSLIAGIAVGLASLTALTAAGLAALLHAAPLLQIVMKAIGSIYLLWLAWRIGMSGTPDVRTNSDVAPISFSEGVLLLWLNPKAWTMAVGAAASYTALTTSPFRLAILLAAVFGTAAAASLSIWCACGLVLAKTIRDERQWRIANAVLGLMLAASVVTIWV